MVLPTDISVNDPGKGVSGLAKLEITSKRAASAASKALRDPRASKAAKTAAGLALTQRLETANA
jgi:hypothetical protein